MPAHMKSEPSDHIEEPCLAAGLVLEHCRVLRWVQMSSPNITVQMKAWSNCTSLSIIVQRRTWKTVSVQHTLSGPGTLPWDRLPTPAGLRLWQWNRLLGSITTRGGDSRFQLKQTRDGSLDLQSAQILMFKMGKFLILSVKKSPRYNIKWKHNVPGSKNAIYVKKTKVKTNNFICMLMLFMAGLSLQVNIRNGSK